MPRQTAEPDRRTDPPGHLKRFAGYPDGSAFVVCDRKEPSAWIRSDVTVEIRQ